MYEAFGYWTLNEYYYFVLELGRNTGLYVI